MGFSALRHLRPMSSQNSLPPPMMPAAGPSPRPGGKVNRGLTSLKLQFKFFCTPPVLTNGFEGVVEHSFALAAVAVDRGLASVPRGVRDPYLPCSRGRERPRHGERGGSHGARGRAGERRERQRQHGGQQRGGRVGQLRRVV